LPRSIWFCVLFTLIAVLSYGVLNHKPGQLFLEQTYVDVAVKSFNLSAIIGLFGVLFLDEKATNAAFGAKIRDNISIIIVALIINFIQSFISLINLFL